jgi:hypothetical protein
MGVDDQRSKDNVTLNASTPDPSSPWNIKFAGGILGCIRFGTVGRLPMYSNVA